jgi:glycosyl transferase family 87
VVLVFLLSVALFLLRNEQDGAAAVILALALFKPQIPAMIALALLLHGRRRFFAIFSASSLVVALASLYAIGWSGLRQLLALAAANEPQQQAWRMISLRGLLSLVHAPHWLIAAASAVVILVFAARWRTAQDVTAIFCSAVLVGVLISFHFYLYDGAVLLIPLACMESTSKPEWLDYVLIPLCAGPLFLALAFVKLWALLCIPVLIVTAEFWKRLSDRHPSGADPAISATVSAAAMRAT